MLKDLYRDMFGLEGLDETLPRGGGGGGGGGGATDEAPVSPTSRAEELPDYHGSAEEDDEELCAAADGFAVAESDEGEFGGISIDESDDGVGPINRPWPFTPCRATAVDIAAQRAQSMKKKGKKGKKGQVKIVKKPAGQVKVVKKPAMDAPSKTTTATDKLGQDHVFRLVKEFERGQHFVQIRNTISKQIMLQVTVGQAGDMEKAVQIAEQLADKAEDGLSKEELKELRNQLLA